jgi:hypothetical protein
MLHMLERVGLRFDRRARLPGTQCLGFAHGALGAPERLRNLPVRSPRRIRVDRRLPALSSFFGRRPAQEIKCPAVGKRLMSRPDFGEDDAGAERADTGNGGQERGRGARCRRSQKR